MNTSVKGRTSLLVATAVLTVLGLTTERALAQQGNPPPRPRTAPRATPELPQESAGWLGITMDEVTTEKAQEVRLSDVHGVLVTGVNENSPAAKACLAGGDIITAYGGERVEGTLALRRLVRETPPGRAAKISVWREGRNREFSVEIGRAPAPPSIFGQFEDLMPRIQRSIRSALAGPRLLGVVAQDVSGQFGSYLGVPDGQGVLVTEVRPGSVAERGGLQAGDVITAVDGERVRTTRDLQARLRARVDAPGNVALRVIRRGAETTVNVQLEGPRPQSGPAALRRSISI